jgi:uncharacterized damage-inducible protein DinB
MGNVMSPVAAEFREEAATTKRVLGRVPEEKLEWRPHVKSMTLGQLAWHVAVVPGSLAKIVVQDGFDVSQGSFTPPQPKSTVEILNAFEESIRNAEQCLQNMTDQQAVAQWRLSNKDRELMCRPRIEIVRTIMLNHWYHHRGQLSVYLRLLNVPLPVIYGPSADENPFA